MRIETKREMWVLTQEENPEATMVFDSAYEARAAMFIAYNKERKRVDENGEYIIECWRHTDECCLITGEFSDIKEFLVRVDKVYLCEVKESGYEDE